MHINVFKNGLELMVL